MFDPITWGMLGAAAIGGGASIFGGHRANRENKRMANEANALSLANSREAMAFSERMSSTALQRAKADMLAAGLNPMLMYSQGGASSPSGISSAAQAAKSENIGKDMPEVSRGVGNALITKAQLRNYDAQNAALVAQANLSNSSARKVMTETELLGLTKGKEKFWSDLYDIPGHILHSAKSYKLDVPPGENVLTDENGKVIKRERSIKQRSDFLYKHGYGRK